MYNLEIGIRTRNVTMKCFKELKKIDSISMFNEIKLMNVLIVSQKKIDNDTPELSFNNMK